MSTACSNCFAEHFGVFDRGQCQRPAVSNRQFDRGPGFHGMMDLRVNKRPGGQSAPAGMNLQHSLNKSGQKLFDAVARALSLAPAPIQPELKLRESLTTSISIQATVC